MKHRHAYIVGAFPHLAAADETPDPARGATGRGDRKLHLMLRVRSRTSFACASRKPKREVVLRIEPPDDGDPGSSLRADTNHEPLSIHPAGLRSRPTYPSRWTPLTTHPVAPALAHEEVELGAGVIAVALRIRPGRECDLISTLPLTIAIDPESCTSCTVCTSSGVGTPSKVKFKGVGHRKRAHAELAPEVVACRDAGQHLNRAHRIVGGEAAQLLELAAVERLLSACAVVCCSGCGDTDGFAVSAGSGGDRNRDIELHACGDLDRAPHEL